MEMPFLNIESHFTCFGDLNVWNGHYQVHKYSDYVEFDHLRVAFFFFSIMEANDDLHPYQRRDIAASVTLCHSQVCRVVQWILE